MTAMTKRILTLTEIGLLPETAQRIVDTVDARSGAALSEADASLAARISAEDIASASVFVVYSALIPDWMRLLWTAQTLA